MSIVFTCSGGHRLRAPEKSAGRRVRCPRCKEVVIVPAPRAQGSAAQPQRSSKVASEQTVEAMLAKCSREQREQVLAAAWIAAGADRRLGKSEKQLLREVQAELGVDGDTARRMHRDVRAGTLKVSVPKKSAAGRLMLHYALKVAAVDGTITPRERQLAERLGNRLGLSEEEVGTRLDEMVELLEEPIEKPFVPPDDLTALLASLHRSPSGSRGADFFRKSFLPACVPVVVTYVLSATGLALGLAGEVRFGGEKPAAIAGGFIVLLFTVSHAVVPVFFYRLFQRRRITPATPFVYLHMGSWFGIPIVVLSAMTGWISLAGPVVHVARARRGTRTWVFLEYGSTSMALLLSLGVFSSQAMFPGGILVVLAQALLLSLVRLLGRPLWVKEIKDGEPAAKRRQDFSRPQRRRAVWVGGIVGLIVGLLPVLFFFGFAVLAATLTGEWTPLLFIGAFGLISGLVFGAGIGITVYLVVLRLQPSSRGGRVAPYEQFAQRVGGTLKMSEPMLFGLIPRAPQRVAFSHAGYDASLEVVTEHHGDNATTYTDLTFVLTEATDLECSVSPQGVLAQLGTLFGMQDLELGWPEFDRRFVVKSNQPNRLPHVLHRDVLQLLVQLKDWAEGSDQQDYLALTIEGEEVRVRTGGLLTRVEDAMTLYELGGQLFDSVARRL